MNSEPQHTTPLNCEMGPYSSAMWTLYQQDCTFSRAPATVQRSESGRALGGDGEGALESDANAPEGAFLEETADQGDTVRHAAWGRKLWQRIFRIGSPVRAGL